MAVTLHETGVFEAAASRDPRIPEPKLHGFLATWSNV